ncbi:stage II sporulation protein E [Paenibacillus thermoaerophilus]|uniref:Stage II sporulation protein E n=1 Tax=Paenibacillus thermoaerophilus TaxID=1215385 RepID=A0ABW2V2B2_9BACL|nr:stage II sporulation protein E [Paenibacillus thermoaerophilus]
MESWKSAGTRIGNWRWVQWFDAKKWSLLLLAMGFLLGRAMVLETLAPFALAYFAVLYYHRRDLLRWAGVAIVAGSLLAAQPQTAVIAAEMLVFLLFQKGLERFERQDISHAPMLVFASMLAVQVFAEAVGPGLGWFELMLSGVEAAFGFVLTMIFRQAIPVFTLTKKNYALRNEEIICLMILLASVMTGTVGWVLYGVSVEHVLSRLLILLFALVGGASLGASVGVVAGLILSLANPDAVAQMSLLAFAGLLGGLMREGGKPTVALGMLLGSSILSVYLGSQQQAVQSAWESVAAVVFFLLTPRSFLQTIAKYVPGTQEHQKSQLDYAKRVREVTARRVQQFSDVFKQLSSTFKQPAGTEEERKEAEVGHFMNAVAQRACWSCHRRSQCWDRRFSATYQFMTQVMSEIEKGGDFHRRDIKPEWRQACVRTERVLDVLKQQYESHRHDLHWKKQIAESRQLVADQLSGVSQVMADLAREIQREGQEMFLQEEQIRQALEELGLSILTIDIISLDPGNVEIEVVHQYRGGYDECRKIIAPLLSDILGENISVKHEEYVERDDGFYTVTFGSAKEFDIVTGVAAAAKGGDLLSGDSYSALELGNGKFAVAISDGMGNGERAKAESSAALSILQQLLQSGIDEHLAIKSVNSVLNLRSSDEMYATVDLALIDLYSAKTTFMKIGSTPSFIKRGNDVLKVAANNLPIGILKDIEVDLVSKQLQPGDTLIMMTDGIYDAPGPAVNKELWMKRMIQELAGDDPQELADQLLDRIVRHHHGDIVDDMTVVVAKVEKYKPEWATFRWPGLASFERPKTVS